MTITIDRPAPLPPEVADALASRCLRETGEPDADVRYYPVASSTNDLALRLAAEGAPDGTVVLADQQTAGRGRGGHVWFSPPDAGVYATMLLRPRDDGAEDWPRWLTLTAGVALAEGVLAATGLPVAIKWPNDLVVAAGTVRGARKLGGVLAEAQTSGGRLEAVVVGYGLNVGLTPFPAEFGDRATSLERELGRPIQRLAVMAATLEALARWVRRLRAEGNAPVVARWQALAVGLAGAAVEWQEGAHVRHGVTSGIDGDGALLVRHGGGTSSVRAGEVRWL